MACARGSTVGKLKLSKIHVGNEYLRCASPCPSLRWPELLRVFWQIVLIYSNFCALQVGLPQNEPLATTHRQPLLLIFEVCMFLAVIAVIILLMKIGEVGPVANWSWFYVLLPFGLLAFWWEYLSKWVGWDKRTAERKMAAEVKAAEELKKKTRGF